MKIGIGIPTHGTVTTHTVETLVGLLGALTCDGAVITETGPYIQWNREMIVRHAQVAHCNYLFFLDHDIECPRETINRLVAHEKDIIGCAYNIRGTHVSAVKSDLPRAQWPQEPFRVTAIPTGAALIRMAVFEAIPSPWFQIDAANIGATEDVWFCRQATHARIGVWCDAMIPVKHWGEAAY